METKTAAELLFALGHESRLAIFRLLVEAGPEGINASAIGEQLGLVPATLSFHLAHLSRVGLIQGKRESRFIHYSAEYGTMDELIAFLTNNCCQGQPCLPKAAATDSIEKRRGCTPQNLKNGPPMTERVFNVLFLCTGNSARSILAEAILDHVGRGRFRAFSAGSHPTGEVHPIALELLEQQGFSVSDLRSKSWDEFAAPDAPTLDFVFTVCDKAAGEICPVWPGQPMTAHWGIEDPAAAEGDDDTRRAAMSDAFHRLNRRISLFVSLPLAKLDAISLRRQLDDIGQLSQQGQ
jgi:arsenate reductase